MQKQYTKLLLKKQTKKQRRKLIIKTPPFLSLYVHITTDTCSAPSLTCTDDEWLEGAAWCSSQVPKSNPHRSLLIIVWHCHTRGQEERKTTMLLLLGWSSMCIERESRFEGFLMFLADQQAGIPSGMLVTDQSDGGMSVGAGVIGRAGETGANPSQTHPPSGDHRRGVVVIDHVTVGGGVWAAAGRWGTPLVLNLEPGLAQCLGEVVVHRACDGHRVGGGWLRLLVVLPEAAAEMLLDDRVTGCIG